MFDRKFNSGTTNISITINLFWDIWPQTFVLREAENINLVKNTLKFNILVKGDLEDSHGFHCLSLVSNCGRVKP